jgi:hypothetical protein
MKAKRQARHVVSGLRARCEAIVVYGHARHEAPMEKKRKRENLHCRESW